MAKVSVDINLPRVERFTAENIANSKFQTKLGVTVVGLIKDMVEVGVSPVAKQGRFPGYKADRMNDRRNKKYYPNSVKKKYPNKQRRPVNLHLSGEMMKAFSFEGIVGGVRIGIIKASQRIKTIFAAHNSEKDNGRKFPRRAVIPDATGETFVPKLMKEIKELYAERIREIINKR